MASTLKTLFGRRGSEAKGAPSGGASEFSDSPDTAPAWLKGGVYKPNKDVGKTLPIAWDGTSGTGAGNSAPKKGGAGASGPPALATAGRGGANTIVAAADSRKLRSTLELPEGQVQIMVDPEAARIWGAIREVSEVLIEKALLCGEVELVAKFRQELAVLQIRNPGLLHSDALCNLLNELSHVDLLGLPRQRAVLALQKILLTMQVRHAPAQTLQHAALEGQYCWMPCPTGSCLRQVFCICALSNCGWIDNINTKGCECTCCFILSSSMMHPHLSIILRLTDAQFRMPCLPILQELSQRSEYQYAAEGVDPEAVRGLPPSSLPDLTIYIQDYKVRGGWFGAAALQAGHGVLRLSPAALRRLWSPRRRPGLRLPPGELRKQRRRSVREAAPR